jgi:hypothetical protein
VAADIPSAADDENAFHTETSYELTSVDEKSACRRLSANGTEIPTTREGRALDVILTIRQVYAQIAAPATEACTQVKLKFRLNQSRTHSNRSPGWQFSSRHSASSVVKRTALALFVLSTERFANVSPIRSASSVSVIPRSASTASSLTCMAICQMVSD